VRRLGSVVWVSASFQIFTLTDGGNVPVGGVGNCPAGEICPRGKCPRGNVIHSFRIRCKLMLSRTSQPAIELPEGKGHLSDRLLSYLKARDSCQIVC